ncbi:MAG: hypothetical protein FWC80_05260 [Firmicutes bacterium]|nr:hypothetical protein [Bacillota bacterium]
MSDGCYFVGSKVIARSESDEAIPRIGHFTWDCFVALLLAMTIVPMLLDECY